MRYLTYLDIYNNNLLLAEKIEANFFSYLTAFKEQYTNNLGNK